MLEFPEVNVLAKQLNETIPGKKIKDAVANYSPHKLVWYSSEPSSYREKLIGKTIEEAYSFGGRLEIKIDDVVLNFNDGINLRFYKKDDKKPVKHQLYLLFDDGSVFAATVTMYAGIWCGKQDEIEDNLYYIAAKKSVSPLSQKFTYEYFKSFINEKTLKMSAKAFLATEQRFPGIGNGVLQDILLNAKIHPKKKINTLTEQQMQDIFQSIKTTLSEMVNAGGRDTEKDLFGSFGGYATKLSKNTVFSLCPNCNIGHIKKENYMGGSIYYCESCQIK
ncbi:MAG: endonuclease VIII [Oscillospiraceae bacterium]|nr:endonuclease VIII [Oscillospiraceae bacterium]